MGGQRTELQVRSGGCSTEKATIKYNKSRRNKKKQALSRTAGQDSGGRMGAVCVTKGRANICDSDHITRAEPRF